MRIHNILNPVPTVVYLALGKAGCVRRGSRGPVVEGSWLPRHTLLYQGQDNDGGHWVEYIVGSHESSAGDYFEAYGKLGQRVEELQRSGLSKTAMAKTSVFRRASLLLPRLLLF